MRTPLNTKYRTLIVYFNIHASMPLQSKAYSPKFINKLLLPAILPYLKTHCRGTHGIIYSSVPQPLPENFTTNLAEKLFLKNGVS